MDNNQLEMIAAHTKRMLWNLFIFFIVTVPLIGYLAGIGAAGLYSGLWAIFLGFGVWYYYLTVKEIDKSDEV